MASVRGHGPGAGPGEQGSDSLVRHTRAGAATRGARAGGGGVGAQGLLCCDMRYGLCFDIDFPCADAVAWSDMHCVDGGRLRPDLAASRTWSRAAGPIGMATPATPAAGRARGRARILGPDLALPLPRAHLLFATLRGIDIHPVNYLFLAGAFFVFHLLFAYTADRPHGGVGLRPRRPVTVVFVVSYLRLVVSSRFAFVEAGLAQLVYLVGFSLAALLGWLHRARGHLACRGDAGGGDATHRAPEVGRSAGPRLGVGRAIGAGSLGDRRPVGWPTAFGGGCNTLANLTPNRPSPHLFGCARHRWLACADTNRSLSFQNASGVSATPPSERRGTENMALRARSSQPNVG